MSRMSKTIHRSTASDQTGWTALRLPDAGLVP